MGVKESSPFLLKGTKLGQNLKLIQSYLSPIANIFYCALK